jgi:hypothetical protein
MKINVHIERLILDGLPIERRDGAAVQAAVEAELARLFHAGQLSPALRSSSMVAGLRAAFIELPESVSPAGLGQQIAQAVHTSLGHSQ